MPVRTEFSLRLPNSPGALAEFCRDLASERVSIVALTLDPSGRLRLVVDNEIRTQGLLRERRHSVSTRDVLVLEAAHAPGGLAPILTLLAQAGVNVEYAYAGAADGGPKAVLVLGVDDPMRAATAAGL